MLEKLFNSIKNRPEFTSYQISLLQAKSHRILKNHTTKSLQKYKLSALEWTLMGLLFDTKEMRYGEIAEQLGVEAPFVSVLVEQLEKKKLIRQKQNKDDRRVKNITLTKKALKIIPDIEAHVKKGMSQLLEHISTKDLTDYMDVLDTIVKNNNYTSSA